MCASNIKFNLFFPSIIEIIWIIYFMYFSSHFLFSHMKIINRHDLLNIHTKQFEMKQKQKQINNLEWWWTAMLDQLQINRSRSVCCNKSLTPWSHWIRTKRLRYQNQLNYINHTSRVRSDQTTWMNINYAKWNWTMVNIHKAYSHNWMCCKSKYNLLASTNQTLNQHICIPDAPKNQSFEGKPIKFNMSHNLFSFSN